MKERVAHTDGRGEEAIFPTIESHELSAVGEVVSERGCEHHIWRYG